LCSQIKRAADSVVFNIAEGSKGASKPEFKRYPGIALRSGIEVVSCLLIGRTRNYIAESDFQKFYSDYEVLCKKITALRNSIG
jgi:four helix bundle protein